MQGQNDSNLSVSNMSNIPENYHSVVKNTVLPDSLFGGPHGVGMYLLLVVIFQYYKHEMCRLLVDQFTSVFTIPDPRQIITDPVSFFTHEPTNGINKLLSLTDIMLNEDIIIEAIHELPPNSAAGPEVAGCPGPLPFWPPIYYTQRVGIGVGCSVIWAGASVL